MDDKTRQALETLKQAILHRRYAIWKNWLNGGEGQEYYDGKLAGIDEILDLMREVY